jgi:hypothetical protein
MPTELPKKVRIGSFVWTVETSPKTTLALALDGHYGDTNLETLTIRVRGDIHPELARETLFHEMIHAALLQTPLADWPSEQQEAICRALPPFLLEHVVVNGWTDV